MVSRRQFLTLCGCTACAPLLPSLSQAQTYADDDYYFYCDTPQIAKGGLGEVAFSGAGRVGDSPQPGSGGQIATDPYGTVTRALRWTKLVTRGERNGLPLVLIGFLDGASAQREAVQNFSSEWLRHGIPIAFDFTDNLQQSHIRITFTGSVNKSKVGIDAAVISKSSSTMSLPDVRTRPGTEAARRAVLHEFGHGLMAFGHEHRHPDAGYKFKSSREIRDIINATLPDGATRWTTEMVETNITNPPYASSRVCSNYDVNSIMHYPVAANWLKEGTPVPRPQTTLSPLDIQCALETYGS